MVWIELFHNVNGIKLKKNLGIPAIFYFG